MTHKALDGLATAIPHSHNKGALVSSSEESISHIVVQGVFAALHVSPVGTPQIVGYHLPGDVCGLAAVTGLQQGCEVRALSPALSIPIATQSLNDLTLSSPAFGQALLNAICIEAAIANHWISNGHRSALHRIAHHICELEARLSSIGLAERGSFRWWGNQSELGAAAGLSLVHVNKILRTLRELGLVEWGNPIRVLDLPRLQALARFDPSYLALEQPRLAYLMLPDLGRELGKSNGDGRHHGYWPTESALSLA